MSADEVVVAGGELIDGSGAPSYRADVGIRNGVVVEIGDLSGQRWSRTIDAEGCFVTPGFIDGHTHLDAQVHWDPLATSVAFHGVTTAILGNCGFTLAPRRPAETDLVLRNLERAEDIPRAAMLSGIRWDWESFPQFLDNLDRLPKAINYGCYLGHSALRTYVMGERAFDGPGDEDDRAAMVQELREAMDAGVFGLSTSRSANHETADDRPVASRLADWVELGALVEAMGRRGGGVFQLAPIRSDDPVQQADFSRRLQEVVARSGCPATYMVGSDQWLLDLLDLMADRGLPATGQVHCREYLTVSGFGVSLPFDRLPAWSELRSRPLVEQGRLLARPEVRERLIAEAARAPAGREVGAVRNVDFDRLRLVGHGDGPPVTVGDVARQRDVHPVAALIDLSLATNLRQLFAQPIGATTREFALSAMRHPHTVLAASDSGAHVGQIIDSSIPTFLLSHWVRDQGQFTWEAAIRMLTAEPARVWGLAQRGSLSVGSVADVVVFDPDTVGPAVPEVVYDLPDGSGRLLQRAEGIRSVLVAGHETLGDGEDTGTRQGRLLRRGRTA